MRVNTKKPKAVALEYSRASFLSILLIMSLGLGATFSTVTAARNAYESSLIQRASSIAEALPTEDIVSLQANQADKSKAAYAQLEERLGQVQNVNRDVQYVYIATLQKNLVYVVADSTSGSGQAAEPNKQLVEETTENFKQAFYQQDAWFEGPIKRRGGTWFATYAPVYNDKTNSFIGLLGIDTPIWQYYSDVGSKAVIPLFLAIMSSLLLWRMEHLRKKREEVVLLKSQFVSIASHELRSPLSGLLWGIQTLLKSRPTKDQETMLMDMYKSTESSIATVNEILDLSIFERGKSTNLQHATFDLVTTISEVIKNLKLGAAERNINLQTQSMPDKRFIKADPGAIKRALMNVVSNAIKYSPNGSTVSVIYTESATQHGIAVKDEGIGIPKADQQKILAGYYRAANAAKVEATGTGLGLYVTKLIIEEHGGSLVIDSEEGKGTIITLYLPKNESQPADSEAAAPQIKT